MPKSVYLTVDLELHGAAPFPKLRELLEREGLYVDSHPVEGEEGQHLANTSLEPGASANDCVLNFCDRIANATKEIQAEWKAQHRRIFNVGIETSSTDWASRFELSSDAIERMAELGAGLEITLYPVEYGND